MTFTAAAAAGCGGYAVNTTHTTTVHLAATGGGPDLLIVVTIQVQPGSPLTVTPVPAAPSITMTYVKGSGMPAVANVSVSSSIPSAFFTVNAATLPIWLTVSATVGYCNRASVFQYHKRNGQPCSRHLYGDGSFAGFRLWSFIGTNHSARHQQTAHAIGQFLNHSDFMDHRKRRPDHHHSCLFQ